MQYQFRQAREDDVDDIIAIIQDRIDWMDREGL